MNELHTRCLDTFPEWLRSLGTDASFDEEPNPDFDPEDPDAYDDEPEVLRYFKQRSPLVPDL